MYSFESRVRYSETDAAGWLTIEKLIDYFQDCSTFQSEELGVGVAHMRAQGLAWIIVYWRVEIARMPILGEKIRIGTFPYGMKGGIGLRNFFLETADGERLAVANSVWTLVSAGTMRPVRIPDRILASFPPEDRLEMEYDARKIRLPDREGTERTPVIVREYHLDTNRHMNNGQYVRIAAGFLPPEAAPSVLRIEYRRQAVLGDRIVPVVYEEEAGEQDAAGGAGLQSLPEGKAREGALPKGGGAHTACISLNADDGKPYAILEVRYAAADGK